MSLANTVGFFTTGFGMEWLPRMMVTDAASDRALWLAVMGGLIMAIGGIHLASMAWKTLPWGKIQSALRALSLADEGDVATGAKVDAKRSVRG